MSLLFIALSSISTLIHSLFQSMVYTRKTNVLKIIKAIQVEVKTKRKKMKLSIGMHQTMNPGQRIRNNSGRNTPEVTGSWKHYSGWKISGFFPVHSYHFPVLSRQKLVGNHRKKSGIFRPEYCFHDPVTSGVFLQDPEFFPSLSCRFLKDLVTRIFDLGTDIFRNKLFIVLTFTNSNKSSS